MTYNMFVGLWTVLKPQSTSDSCSMLDCVHVINFLCLIIIIIICPIAIAYSMGQIIKSVCVCVSVCLSVCLSVCEQSHGRISWSIFTKIGTDVRTPKSKNEFVGGQYRTTPSPIFPPKPPF